MLEKLSEIKKRFLRGDNIIHNYSSESLRDSILVSYDLQAGSYTRDDHKVSISRDRTSTHVSDAINTLGNFKSIMEVGVGEANNMGRIVSKLDSPVPEQIFGFDLSYSRIMYAKNNVSKIIPNVNLFTGDLFHCPLSDNSIDIVYSLHSLEPNGGREEQALQELYRITNKYLLLFEPEFELGSVAAREHINKHGYVKNLSLVAKRLGYNVLEHKLLYASMTTKNNTGVTVIKKEGTSDKFKSNPFACPIAKTPLELIKDNYFSKESLLLYPIINEIPCLLPDNAIVASHYADELK
jgi:ubiquinone/menaquinone biosynthesis C-methylase UbiE/uncharacterized protein YbaR (Trm112 family)